MPFKRYKMIFVCASFLTFSLPAIAGEGETIFGENADESEVEDLFNPSLSTAPIADSFKLPANVLRPKGLKEGEAAEVPSGSNKIIAAVAVPGVEFSSSSSELTDNGERLVNIIGKSLNRNSHDVLVVGHTDAYGKEDYNLQLSQNRALTVAYYIVNVIGVKSDRVKYTGVGSSDPLNPNNPYAKENRRVTFIISSKTSSN